MRRRGLVVGLLAVAWALGLLGCGQTGAEGPVPPAGEPVLVAEGLASPCGLGFDGRGRLYVAEAGTGRVLVLGQGGERTVLVDGIEELTGLAVDRDNRVLALSRSRGEVLRIDPRGGWTVLVSGLHQPQGLLAERFGGLLVFEGPHGRVLHLGRDGALRVVADRGVRSEATVCEDPDRVASRAGQSFSRPDIAAASLSGSGIPGLTLAASPLGVMYVVNPAEHSIWVGLGGRRRGIALPQGQEVTGLGCDRDGALFFCTRQGRVYRVPA